jgi:hypothetical protein
MSTTAGPQQYHNSNNSTSNRRDARHIRDFRYRRDTKNSRYTRKRKDVNNSRIPETAEAPTTA